MATRLTNKNTGIKNKPIRPDQLGLGEIAINNHESGAFLQVKNNLGEIIRVGGVIIQDEQPGLAQKGAFWLSLSKDTLFVFTGTHWHPLAGAGEEGPAAPPEFVPPGNGTLSIVGPDGATVGTFTANQAVNTTINLPPPKWAEIQDLPCLYLCNAYIPSLAVLPES